MAIINIKKKGLEAVLNQASLSEEDAKKIRGDFDYYDEYYLTTSGKTVKAFQQEFIKDPYMDLSPIPELRLIIYQAGVSLNDLEQIFEMSNVPIITRMYKGAIFPGFNYILNKKGQKTELIPIKITIPDIDLDYGCSFIRPMEAEDLSEITELFRREYSLRYRVVQLMFHECPEACFVYEREDKILGVAFNKIDCNELYMRQLFVRDGYRGKGIGSSLRKRRLQFAKEKDILVARANIRGEVDWFYDSDVQMFKENIEYYVIRRF